MLWLRRGRERVIRFVMNYENLDFVSAAKKLAERAGIRIVEAGDERGGSARVTTCGGGCSRCTRRRRSFFTINC